VAVSIWTTRIVVCCGLVTGSAVQVLAGQAVEPTTARPCGVLPANIQASPQLGALLTRLIEQSPTLLRQCLALASAGHVHVRVRHPMHPMLNHCRARARIERRSGGSIHATIEIPVTSDYAELFAHEFEHVIEVAEGLDLPSRARVKNSGVTRTADGTFETIRARQVGHQARAEVYAASR
jgi:hypothetical protein